MNNLTYFHYTYICMKKFNLSEMIIDTKLKLSTYTNIFTSYPKIYYTLL